MAQPDPIQNPARSAPAWARWISAIPLGTRLKSMLARPRLILNPILLLVFSAAWVRDCLYWLHTDAFETSLNYWAYTDWLIDYSQGFIRRGLSGEIWRLVPAALPRLEFVAVFSWVLILASAFGYLRLLVRSWKTVHPLTLFGLLFLPALFFFYIHDHNGIARKEILGYVSVLLHLLIIERTFPLGEGARAPGWEPAALRGLAGARRRDPAPGDHPGPRGKFPAVRPAACADHADGPADEGRARLLAGRLMDRAAVSACGAGLRRRVPVRHTRLHDAAGHLRKMVRARRAARRLLYFAPRKAERVDPAGFLHSHAVVAGENRLHHTRIHFHELESLDPGYPDAGDFALVSGPAGAVFHSAFPEPAVLLGAGGAALYGRILLQVFPGPAPGCPAGLFHGLGLRPLVHGHLH